VNNAPYTLRRHSQHPRAAGPLREGVLALLSLALGEGGRKDDSAAAAVNGAINDQATTARRCFSLTRVRCGRCDSRGREWTVGSTRRDSQTLFRALIKYFGRLNVPRAL